MPGKVEDKGKGKGKGKGDREGKGMMETRKGDPNRRYKAKTS